MYNFEFIFDEKEIVNCAVKNVLRAYDNRVPDFFPFPKPLSYDNLIKHTGTLDVLVCAVNLALRQIFIKSSPHKQNIEAIQVPLDSLERIVWGVFGALKLHSIYGIDGEEYTPFTLHPNFGNEEHFCKASHRPPTINNTWFKNQHEKLTQDLMNMLDKRYPLLQELFLEKDQKEKENIMSRIQQCDQIIRTIKREITALCSQHDFPNQLLPTDSDKVSIFDIASHWEDIQAQEQAMMTFVPSSAEIDLLPFVPEDFSQDEWPLFSFTFIPFKEIESMKISFTQAFEADKRLMEERKIERKMLILYHAYRHLALIGRNNAQFSSIDNFQSFNIYLANLEKEIFSLTSLVSNKNDKRGLGNQKRALENLVASLRNLVQQDTMNLVHDLGLQAVTIVTAYFSKCLQAREDTLLTQSELEEFICDSRQEALYELHGLKTHIMKIDTDPDTPPSQMLNEIAQLIFAIFDMISGEN